MPVSRRFPYAIALFLAVAAGCRSEPLEAPYVDASSAASAAIKQYDENSDGQLSEAELAKAPGIKPVLLTGDADQDKSLTQAELKSRIAGFVGDEVGVLDFSCNVTLNGAPLEGAVVKAIPEPCLGPTFLPATGTTDKQGTAWLSMGNAQISGMQCGLFKIEITRPDAQGKETIPARYNTATVLGVEIAMGLPTTERGMTFKLTSEP
jgi:hypothetical protein